MRPCPASVLPHPAPGTPPPAWRPRRRSGIMVSVTDAGEAGDGRYRLLLAEAGEQDRRRRKQVDLQREVIDRLQAGHSPDQVNRDVLAELWAARARLERVADVVAAAPNRRSRLVKDLAFLVEDD